MGGWRWVGQMRSILSAIYAASKWSIMLVGVVVIATVSLAIYHAPEVSGWAADKLLTNANAPSDEEMPPTAFAHPYSSGDLQIVGGQGKGLGCSIPKLVEQFILPREGDNAPVSLQMRQACVFHDYCYRHGAATYNYTQADCDYMLLEHAYRLCRFTNLASTQSDCVRKARKVALGVRIGGGGSFKQVENSDVLKKAARQSSECRASSSKIADDRCTSTYFEFDPYPISSNQHSVFRVADAPQNWVEQGASAKALYSFNVKRSGTRVSVMGWNSAGAKICAALSLPGDFRFITAAPLIAKGPSKSGVSEDWFIWWQRYDLNQTGGQFAILSPSRATPADWQNLFPGAKKAELLGCENRAILPPNDTAQQTASRRIWIGTRDRHKEEGNFSEVHVAPRLETASGIRLMTLRTHSCLNNSNVLCFADIVLDPDGATRQSHNPLVVRDNYNDKGHGSDHDRYRNFQSPPFVMADNENPVLAWLRRGDELGRNYNDVSTLRRAKRVCNNNCESKELAGYTGGDAGSVILSEFRESVEPVFVIGRKTSQPRLVSLSTDEVTNKASLLQWRLPTVYETNDIDGENEGISQPPSVRPESLDTQCHRVLGDNWLVRPPIVMSNVKDKDIIVFSRAVLSKAGARPLDEPTLDRLQLEVIVATIGKDTQCAMSEITVVELTDLFKPIDEGSGATEMDLSAALQSLRKRPSLLADIDSNGLIDLIIPNPEAIAESIIVRDFL